MKTKEQLQEMLKDYKRMLNYKENENEITQIKLYTMIDLLERILNED